ncbi:MAG: sel1 repeat family protein [Alphaproteobacteria bacterium]|nr:sel1 repeat family protein [Alphaproteobacteria bacterium]
MKRYYALLTLSFLSTSSLLKAGFNPLELLDLGDIEKATKIAAKVKKLKVHESSSKDEVFSQALQAKRQAVEALAQNQLDAIQSYYEAKELTSARRKALGLPTIRQRVESLIKQREKAEDDLRKINHIFDQDSEQGETLDLAINYVGSLWDRNNETQQEAALNYLMLQPKLTLIFEEAEAMKQRARELLDPTRRKDLKKQMIKLENALNTPFFEEEENREKRDFIYHVKWLLNPILSKDYDDDDPLRYALLYLRDAHKVLEALPSEQEIQAANGRRVFGFIGDEAAAFFLINDVLKAKTPIEGHPLYPCLKQKLQPFVKNAVQQGPANFPQNEENRKVIFHNRDREQAFLRYGFFPDQDSFFYGIQMTRQNFLDQLLAAGTQANYPEDIRNIFRHEIRLKKVGFDEIDPEDLRDDVSEEEFREYITPFYAGGTVPLQFADAYSFLTDQDRIGLWAFSADQKTIYPLHIRTGGIQLGLSHGYFQRLVNPRDEKEIEEANAIEAKAFKKFQNPDDPVDLMLSPQEKELIRGKPLLSENEDEDGSDSEGTDDEGEIGGLPWQQQFQILPLPNNPYQFNFPGQQQFQMPPLEINNFMARMNLSRLIYPENPQWRQEIAKLLSPLPFPDYQLLAQLEEDRETPRSIKQYIAQAKKGNVEALYRLAEVYQKGGKGILKNPQRARDLYKAAVLDFGSAKALCQLAEMYENADDVEQNIPFAITLYEKAAERDRNFYGAKSNALTRLFEMYEDEQGVEQSPEIICKLAYAFLMGEPGLWQDEEKAFELFDKAAEKADAKGDVAALHKLTEIYTMLNNFEKAEDLRKRAATAARVVSVPLRRASYNASEGAGITEESGVITVRTDNRGLHKYQLESERIPVKPGDRLKISYNITSSEDGIVLGLLKTHRAGWLPDSQVDLRGGSQQGTFEVLVPEGESAPYFVFYNNQKNARSTEVTIHSLRIVNEEK